MDGMSRQQMEKCTTFDVNLLTNLVRVRNRLLDYG